MVKKVLRWIGALLLSAAIVAGYVALAWLGATPFELVLTTVMILMVIVVGALVIHLRAVHRALYQANQVAYKGFMLEFFLGVKTLLRERRDSPEDAGDDLVWSLLEDYFRREVELYYTVVEELYDKTSLMHMLERGRVRKEPGLPDARPVEPLYSGLHDLLGRLRDEREARREAAGGRPAGPAAGAGTPRGARV